MAIINSAIIICKLTARLKSTGPFHLPLSALAEFSWKFIFISDSDDFHYTLLDDAYWRIFFNWSVKMLGLGCCDSSDVFGVLTHEVLTSHAEAVDCVVGFDIVEGDNEVFERIIASASPGECIKM